MELIIKIIDLFHKGGPVMYLLLACSLSIVTVAVERYLYYRSIATDTQHFQNKLQALPEKQHFLEAVQLFEKTPAVVARVALAGRLAYQRGSQPERALETSAVAAADKLRERLDILTVFQ